MKITTQRIDVVPLCLMDLKSLVGPPTASNPEEKCFTSDITLPQEYREELADMLENNLNVWENKNDDYLFFTLWVMVERKTKSAVGRFTFNGMPTPQGDVEVFFSVDPKYRRNGFGCEVMQGVLAWASGANLFGRVLIEADLDNKAAMASLKKLGFKPLLLDDDDQPRAAATQYYKKICKPETLKPEDLDFD